MVICILDLLAFSIFCFLTRPYCRDRDKSLTQMVVGWGSPESPQHITLIPAFLGASPALIYAMAGSSNHCSLSALPAFPKFVSSKKESIWA